MHPEFGPMAILATLSLFLPLPWHWRSGNVATLCIIGWLFITNLIFAVDSFIWSNNIDIVATVWCDISTKLIIGANFALPATCLCICIHLEQISSIRRARTTIEDKKRRQLFEAGMCIGLPVIFMALHYIVQGHRFDIIEGYGCRPTTYFSVASIFIIWIPPILMSIAAIVYAGLALRHFVIRRLSFASHLQTSNSALTTSRYLRLMTMAAVQMIWTITATSYALWFTVMAVPIRPWTTWADVHSDFLRIDQYPDALTPVIVKRAFNVLWWLIPVSTFIFIAFFAFGKDAVDEYRKCLVWVRAKVLRRPLSKMNSKGGFSIMPMSRSKPGLTISKPISQDTTDLTNPESSLPPYSASGSSFSNTNKTPVFGGDENFDTRSEDTRYEHSQYAEGKAISSYADLPIHTPSTAGPFTTGQTSLPHSPEMPHLPPSPLTPPPPNPRLRALILGSPSPVSSTRPLTYPYFDFSPRAAQPPQAFTQ